jgi:predicted metal-dependent hydrolase
MKRAFVYGQQEIGYVVVRNPRLASKVRIHVHSNGRVEVEAPLGRSEREVSAAVRKRARWIVKRVGDQSQRRAGVLPREYKSGETCFYLGRRYQLKVIPAVADAASDTVSMKGALIRVTARDANAVKIRRSLRLWYRERATEYFGSRLEELAAGISWIEKVPKIKLSQMRKQWGSCSPWGSVHLNPDLVRAPRECIDYVIVHELCHLREHNHSKRYYALLDRHFPEWRRVKQRLDNMAELLLAS